MLLTSIISFVSAGLAGILACAVVVSRRWALSRLLFAVGLIILATEAALSGLSLMTGDLDVALRLHRWRHAPLALAPSVWLAFALIYARGNQSEFLRKWRFVLIALFLVPVSFLVLHHSGVFVEVQIDDTDQPLALLLGWTGYLIHLTVIVGSVLILMQLEQTFRSSVGTTRWRIKFMLMGTALVWAALLFTSSQALVFRAIDPSIQGINAIGLILGSLLMIRTVLRPGHFDTDLYPSSTVVFGSATLLLAGLYLFIVGILAKVVSFLGGDASFTLKALLIMVGLVGIALLVQSDRIRVATRQFASRHFQRPLHNYRSIWQRVTDATGKAETVEQLGEQMVELIATIFEAHSVTLWAFVERGSTPAIHRTASTAKAGNESAGGDFDSIEDPAILQQYKDAKEPFSFESSTQNWAVVLREKNPRQFPEYHAPRIAMPLAVQDEFLGLVTIGDRIGGFAFSDQDLETLQSVGNQFAASMLNLRLSQRMVEAREMEAFQTMATFFIHDLKNAISGLRLMARNLETQFENPEFREDAVRAVSKSVSRIEELIQRMTQLRRQLDIRPEPQDLNQLIQGALTRMGDLPETRINTHLGVLPPIEIDRELMISVVTNLVLNASQSTGEPVEISIAAAVEDGEVILSITDTGLGMDEEFIRTRLFRPFQTTKKEGLGIGLFQSKMIVEAHGGRITVESVVGEGTTFRITLPVSGSRDTEVDGA